MAKARLVLTDSGGTQEETTSLGVPCLAATTFEDFRRGADERPLPGVNLAGMDGEASGKLRHRVLALHRLQRYLRLDRRVVLLAYSVHVLLLVSCILGAGLSLSYLSSFLGPPHIAIVFSGLRPGEKLHEQLHLEGEEFEASPYDKVLLLKGYSVEDGVVVEIRKLLNEGARLEESAIRARLRELVPDYQPAPAMV